MAESALSSNHRVSLDTAFLRSLCHKYQCTAARRNSLVNGMILKKNIYKMETVLDDRSWFFNVGKTIETKATGFVGRCRVCCLSRRSWKRTLQISTWKRSGGGGRDGTKPRLQLACVRLPTAGLAGRADLDRDELQPTGAKIGPVRILPAQKKAKPLFMCVVSARWDNHHDSLITLLHAMSGTTLPGHWLMTKSQITSCFVFFFFF